MNRFPALRFELATSKSRRTEDVKVNLFEIAYLTWEQVNLFRSDFREVARYFVQMREDGEYKPSDDELEHIESVLQLLNVMDKDHRFETEINDRRTGKEIRKMSEWLTRVINENQAIGRAEGRAEGKFELLVSLVRKNLLSIKDAAEQADMTETEFCRKAGLPIKQ
jgi:predicted HTH domain antitoxin